MSLAHIGTFVNTNSIPQIDIIRQYYLRGIAATFPLSTSQRIERWMIVQRLKFNPAVGLGIFDDLIQAGLIRRAYEESRCKCNILEVYRLTDAGYSILKQIL